MSNKENMDKLVKISADRHYKLKLLSVKEHRDMREILNEAFDQYIAQKGYDNKNK